MDITHVLWDWNGTLLDDLDLCIETINEILSAEGLSAVDRETYRDKFGFPITEYYGRLGLDVSGGNFPRLAAAYMALYQPKSANCPLTDGAEGVLERIGAMGITQVILSASRRDLLESQVRDAGIRDRFETLLGIGDIHAASKKEAGLSWKRESGIPGENLLMVGDTLHDLEVAESLGARFLYYSRGHQRVNPSELGPHGRIDRIEEVADFLSGQGGRNSR